MDSAKRREVKGHAEIESGVALRLTTSHESYSVYTYSHPLYIGTWILRSLSKVRIGTRRLSKLVVSVKFLAQFFAILWLFAAPIHSTSPLYIHSSISRSSCAILFMTEYRMLMCRQFAMLHANPPNKLTKPISYGLGYFALRRTLPGHHSHN